MVDIGKLDKAIGSIGVLAIVALLLTGLLYVTAVAPVSEGERGVQKAQGAVTGEIYQPGWNLQIPFYNSAEFIEIRPQTYTMSGNVHEGDTNREDAISFRSADQQQVGADITVRYRVKAEQVDEFHTEYNNIEQFEQRLLRPETIDTVAQKGSGFNATEANSNEGRAEIGRVVQQTLTEQSPDYIVIESVQVRDIYFDDAYRSALEDVEVAQQEAEAERTRAEGEADAERIRAEGDRDAFKIRNEELNEQILQLEQINAYDEGTVYVVPEDQEMILDTQQDSTSQNSTDTNVSQR